MISEIKLKFAYSMICFPKEYSIKIEAKIFDKTPSKVFAFKRSNRETTTWSLLVFFFAGDFSVITPSVFTAFSLFSAGSLFFDTEDNRFEPFCFIKILLPGDAVDGSTYKSQTTLLKPCIYAPANTATSFQKKINSNNLEKIKNLSKLQTYPTLSGAHSFLPWKHPDLQK